MKKTRSIRGNEAGLTLLEITIAVVVLSVGIMGTVSSIVSNSLHGDIVNSKTTSAHFISGILEDMRGMGLTGILAFQPNLPVVGVQGGDPDLPPDQVMFIPGLGPVEDGAIEVRIFAVLPNVSGDPTRFAIWPIQSDPSTVTNFPNPIEVKVQIRIHNRFIEGRPIVYESSSLFNY